MQYQDIAKLQEQKQLTQFDLHLIQKIQQLPVSKPTSSTSGSLRKLLKKSLSQFSVNVKSSQTKSNNTPQQNQPINYQTQLNEHQYMNQSDKQFIQSTENQNLAYQHKRQWSQPLMQFNSPRISESQDFNKDQRTESQADLYNQDQINNELILPQSQQFTDCSFDQDKEQQLKEIRKIYKDIQLQQEVLVDSNNHQNTPLTQASAKINLNIKNNLYQKSLQAQSITQQHSAKKHIQRMQSAKSLASQNKPQDKFEALSLKKKRRQLQSAIKKNQDQQQDVPLLQTKHNNIIVQPKKSQSDTGAFDYVDYQSPFPDWLVERTDFNSLQFSEYFDMQQKIISICNIPTLFEKKIIALYLKKLSLFKLMSVQLLEFIAGRLTAAHFQNGEYICRQGDEGDCMYIIFRGEVDVEIKIQGQVKKVKTFKTRESVGRTSLENNMKRNADLRAKGNTDLLLLSRVDYQLCLMTAFSQERDKYGEFINNIPFFYAHFKPEVITKIINEIKGRFLAPKDCLYKKGDPVDNFYIVKHGLLIKQVFVNLEQSNRWPIKDKQTSRIKWEKKEIVKQMQYSIYYKEGDIVGYYDIVEQNEESIRTETIDAVEDTFVLFFNKSQFCQLFNQSEYDIFREYHKKRYPISYLNLVQKVKKEEEKFKKKIQIFDQALQLGLQTCSSININHKEQKILPIINSCKSKLTNEFNQQIPSKVTKPRITILNSMYDEP